MRLFRIVPILSIVCLVASSMALAGDGASYCRVYTERRNEQLYEPKSGRPYEMIGQIYSDDSTGAILVQTQSERLNGRSRSPGQATHGFYSLAQQSGRFDLYFPIKGSLAMAVMFGDSFDAEGNQLFKGLDDIPLAEDNGTPSWGAFAGVKDAKMYDQGPGLFGFHPYVYVRDNKKTDKILVKGALCRILAAESPQTFVDELTAMVVSDPKSWAKFELPSGYTTESFR